MIKTQKKKTNKQEEIKICESEIRLKLFMAIYHAKNKRFFYIDIPY